MSSDAMTAAFTGIMEMLALVQNQLERVESANERIEEAQKVILARLDRVEAGQASITNLTTDGISIVLECVGYAHAAASGNPAPLPVDLLDEPLLERFALAQPADRTSERRSLVEWKTAARTSGTADLVDLLVRQYRPSPTDTAHTRVLRYQLAAITRSELEARKVALPPVPSSTRSEDRTKEARETRSRELEQLWRGGESAALFADPELAGVLDLFAEAERRSGPISEEDLVAELAVLHRDLSDRLAAGERPSIEPQHVPSADRADDHRPEKDR